MICRVNSKSFSEGKMDNEEPFWLTMPFENAIPVAGRNVVKAEVAAGNKNRTRLEENLIVENSWCALVFCNL
jgi:hypothetical protein